MDLSAQSEKKWLLRQMPAGITDEQVIKIARDLGLPEAIVRILVFRGICTKEHIKDFMVPSLQQLPRPFLMKGMSDAVAILQEAIHVQKPITVFGDFDADGVTSTAVLSLFLTELGVPYQTYIPDRLSEGYGLNSSAIKKIHAANMQQWGKAGILLTVDCGISDAEVVGEARSLGFKIIITDHHKPPEKLPEADAILNPLQTGCDFPCKYLAGVGVAFYLIMGLRSALINDCHWPQQSIPNLKIYMDLVAIGTVADQVPVTGCNRIIVKAGLEIMNQSGRVGLQKLLDTATTSNGGGVTVEDIVYRIAPRINAAGRIASAHMAVKLITTNLPVEAQQFAEQLEKANNDRKNIEAGIFAEAVQMASAENLETVSSLVLYKKDWHQGVLGIVASRLSDQFYRPVILLTDCLQEDNEESQRLVKGSGRSIEGVDIHAAVSSCQGMLLRFGGHTGAVGLTLPAENIEPFRQQIDTVIGVQKEKYAITPSLLIDMEMTLDALYDNAFLTAYAALSPFGSGNPEPVFRMTRQKLTKPRLVGGNHLRFTLMENGRTINGIGFAFGNRVDISQNTLMDLAFTLRLNSYMGQQKWELNLTDLHPSIP
jgi:single-stranded-DNA-specific exonuclease